MVNRAWTVAEIYKSLKWACPIKVIYDGKELYNDLDSDYSGEEVLAQHQNLLKNDDPVHYIKIENVQFHHSIVHLSSMETGITA